MPQQVDELAAIQFLTRATAAPTPAMLTDRYEVTMLSSALADGTAHKPAVFEAFARRLPHGRRYGVVGGTGRLLDLIENFRFDPDEVDWLHAEGAITEQAADYLLDFRFTGDITGYREGDLYFPNSPILTVSGTFGEAVLLETLILSVLNHDSAIASAAARMVTAAGGRPLIEMGSRRAHEQAAVAAARAAYLAGFTSTSNLAAGRLYGIPTVGTAAHAWTLAHGSEADAFRAQVAAHGPGTSLLVDTYDIEQGIRTAVEVAGTELGAIRIDSGDLAAEARKARALLDSLGAERTRILVTSDLDEYVITDLSQAPIDGFGVGTRLVGGSGHPTVGAVYKLVAIGDGSGSMRPVAKKASGKVSVGGRKIAYRMLNDSGQIAAEKVVVRHVPDDGSEAFPGRRLQVPMFRDGVRVHRPTLDETRLFHAEARAELPPFALAVADGTAAFHAEV
jgi:nicotinate phosphoribosyltransferase